MVARRPVVGSGRCGRVPDVGVATATSAIGGRDHRWAWASTAANRCWISLQVSGISPDGGGWWVVGVFGHGRHHQEGVGEHGKGGPAVPGAPAADLVLVQATQALAGLEALFLCAPQALYAVNRHVAFDGYAATFELAETEVASQHWSRR
jgi:hypothetical protein